MIRVLHVLDHSLPMHSGYTFRTRAILKAQQRLGIEVHGITGLRHTMPSAAAEEADGLLFHRTAGQASGMTGLREWREVGLFADAIERVVEDWRPDVIHAHSPALCGQAALRVARRQDIPLVYEIRAFWEDAAVGNGVTRAGSLRYRLTRRLENFVVGHADTIVTICEGLRGDLIARGTAAERITVVPNGVDLSLFGTPPEPDLDLGRELDLLDASGRRRPVVGFIGSFYDYEGLDMLIEAMELLVRYHPEARLLLVGGGPCEEALRRQAAESPAAQAIRFVGRVPHDQVGRYYALTDILAFPRKHSRLTDLVTPLKPLETMAQGKIVCASDVGGHRELIEDGVTGRLFAPDDAQACAGALASLLTHPGRWPAMHEAGRRHVEDRHDWARNAARYQLVYQTLLGLNAQPRLGAAA
ncbi:PEP-CTERM/exosortase A-associated glycosyltransferase [Novosphingobium chloroacetimidivorans]|uniref:PEP-CTERM/exosortase A-associated glycosyltransferase n=1 Tax=Novosphingobium chloroacetimidivorans TaxID=1428314 RepID=A0A7W7NYA3_9SPHN|nr:TIGR04063 family PEP-CTERM/XrtA system glycosyltransferase [Novosphingobium chloroacetimidivorans]MBB4860017.1 PEP-CTERM/exosortase A-associated glycosyltransferase [Novosphingobium chloroacetimidivorans]